MAMNSCENNVTTYQGVVVLTSTRIIKSVVTGQAPVTLELRNTQEKNRNQKWYTHTNIIADAIHASARKIDKK